MVVTIYRLVEEIRKVLNSGNVPAAADISYGEIKVSVGQVANQLLKVEHLQINEAMGEKIPNGSVLGWYEDIDVSTWNNKSKAELPIKPLKLSRNMGVFSIYPKFDTNDDYELDKEFIPIQMGQSSLIRSQPMINDILGQIGYEVFGNSVIFTKDIKKLFPNIKLAMRLVVMDISLYGDYDILPILPEQEWEIKKEVLKLYGMGGIADNLVDSTTKEQQNIPTREQKQS